MVLLLTERTTLMTTIQKPRHMARPAATSAAAPDKRPTKHSLMLNHLLGDGGVPLAAIVTATGWQAHTVRAALTGLRKQGHTIERSKTDGQTRYAITAVAAQ